jgi:exopolyphosphatase/guanosine-5'-triphosphate,3'-diphosphate pyrophosphatase
MRRSVVDVGSNSVLLVVAELQDGKWITLDEFSKVTGLGQGTKSTHLLSEDAMIRTLAALAEAKERSNSSGVTEMVSGATMAARIATNAGEFLARADAQGTPVSIISGDLEAELGFLAVANDPGFAGSERISIVDPGGHSTELVTADRELHQVPGGISDSITWNIRYRRSVPIGALGLRETHLTDESPGFAQRMSATKEIDTQIGLEYRPHEHGTVVVLGATGTNLISIREKLTSWQPEKVHLATLDYEEISRAAAWMLDMTDAERAAISGIEPGREKSLHIGCLILERFLFALRAEKCVVSVRGWRHALLENPTLLSIAPVSAQ